MFWSVGAKRCPFSRKMQNSKNSAKIRKFHEIFIILVNSEEFALFAALGAWVPLGPEPPQNPYYFIRRIPYSGGRGGGGWEGGFSFLVSPPQRG